MHAIRTLPTSPPARRALAILLALLLGLSMLPLAAFADQDATPRAGLDAPGNVLAAVMEEGIQLSWDSVNNASHYNVYRGESSTGNWVPIGLQEGTSYLDTDLMPGATYYYYVVALDGEVPSPPSDVTYATWPSDMQTYAVSYFSNYPAGDQFNASGGEFAAGEFVALSSIASVGAEGADWSREGLAFMGWADRATGAVRQAGDILAMPRNALAFDAVWVPEGDAGNNTLVLDRDVLQPGESVSFTATGDRQDAVGTITGETRYVPSTWTIRPNSIDIPFAPEAPYAVSMAIPDVGSYTVEVLFAQETYDSTSNSWVPGGSATLTADFSVQEAQTYPVVYFRDYPEGADATSADQGSFPADSHIVLSDISSVGTSGVDWSRTDYKFTGWKDMIDGTLLQPGAVVMPDRPLLLSAVWSAPSKVTYIAPFADDGTVPVDDRGYYANDTVTVSSLIPTRSDSGLTFGGWRDFVTGQVFQPGGEFAMPEGGVVLLALWAEHADAGNNTLVLDSNVLRPGDMVFLTATGDRQDAVGSAGGETRFVPKSWGIVSLYNDLPFYAEYPFVASTLMNQLGSYTATATFEEQFYNICCDQWLPTGNTTTLTADFVVKDDTNPVSYYRNHSPEDAFVAPGGDYAPGSLVFLSAITSVGTTGDDFTRDGYRFMGWSTDRTDVWGADVVTLMPDGPLDLYATWSLLHPVTYDGDGADGGIVPVDDNQYVAGDLVDVPRDTPTKTGYTFGGWVNTYTGLVHQPGGAFYMTDDGANLKALWAEHADAGNNTLVIENDDLAVGDTVRFTATGDRQDAVGSAGGETRFTPVSWVIEPGFTYQFFANQFPFTDSAVMNAPGNYTLTAVFVEEFFNICCDRWEPTGQCVSLSAPFTVRAPGAYAVVYDGNGHDGGTVPVDALAYAKDDAVTVAAGEPTKAGHAFAGWKADHDGKVYRAGDTFAMPEGGARLVAQWTPQAAPVPNGNQPAKPGTPATLSKAGFLPKTGDEAVPFVLLGVAAAAGALGVRSLRRKAE